MGGQLTAFDGVNLPLAAMEAGLQGDDRLDGMVTVAGGGLYRAFGTDRSPAKPPVLTHKAKITGATLHAMQDILDPILAKQGKSGTLTMTMGDATSRTRTAELLPVEYEVTYQTRQAIPVDLRFQCISIGWKGTAHNDTTTLDTSPKSITVANGGNRRVTDAIITVSVPGGGTPMTGLNIYVAGISYISFSGTIAAGTSLVIDCGALTALNNGADAWSGIIRNATDHKIDDLLRLEAGNNSVVVSHTDVGTNSTVNFAYSDGWE